jgi:3-oxoadipate enol-lactonase
MKIRIEGVPIAYDAAGHGLAVVLLHGLLLDRSIWDDQAAALAGRFRVVRPDLRGAGESGAGEGPALMESLAGDVYGLLDALEIERAVIVGHGMGGYAALAFFRMYAERVAGLALVASGVGADSPRGQSQREGLAAALAARDMGAAIDAYLPRAFAPGAPVALAVRTREIMVRQSVTGAAAHLSGVQQRVDSTDLLEDIAVPALILAGADDGWIDVAAAASTAGAIAGCEFIELAGTGHMPMLEAPHATTAALEALLERCAEVAH